MSAVTEKAVSCDGRSPKSWLAWLVLCCTAMPAAAEPVVVHLDNVETRVTELAQLKQRLDRAHDDGAPRWLVAGASMQTAGERARFGRDTRWVFWNWAISADDGVVTSSREAIAGDALRSESWEVLAAQLPGLFDLITDDDYWTDYHDPNLNPASDRDLQRTIEAMHTMLRPGGQIRIHVNNLFSQGRAKRDLYGGDEVRARKFYLYVRDHFEVRYAAEPATPPSSGAGGVHLCERLYGRLGDAPFRRLFGDESSCLALIDAGGKASCSDFEDSDQRKECLKAKSEFRANNRERLNAEALQVIDYVLADWSLPVAGELPSGATTGQVVLIKK